MLGTLECRIDIGTRLVVCHEPIAPGATGNAAVLGQNQVKMASANVLYDSTTAVFGLDVTVQNLLAEVIGTPNGETITGISVFYESEPVAAAYYTVGDTGTVTVINSDGVATFSRSGQKYHHYHQILAPGEISRARRWEWSVPRSVARFSFTVRAFAALPSEGGVPATVPDSLPSALYAPENIGTDLEGLSGTYLRDVVTVLFVPGSSQEERLAAISSIGGHVIGGIPLPNGDGTYYIRIPRDSTAGEILNAVDALNLLPIVAGASPEFLYDVESMLDYRRPDDGSGWAKGDWSLDASTPSAGFRWGLEAIDAPRAWGCETGSTQTYIAVADVGFHPDSSDDSKYAERSYFPSQPIMTSGHGDMTSSIVAARGNNTSGMTGVMWNARLEMVEMSTDMRGNTVPAGYAAISTIHGTKIGTAALQGARVINVSAGAHFSAAADQRIRNGTPTRNDMRAAQEFAGATRRYLRYARLLGRRPLVVFSAGNDNYDAFWNGYPQLVDALPDQVVVVANVARAANSTGGYRGGPFNRHVGPTQMSGSNYGSRVQIAAPGEGIGALGAFGNIRAGMGTSAAAPMVTGVAGLLFSFDPRLSAGEVKNILIEGARAGNRWVDNGPSGADLPVLNAYESLKLAARRTGAPLCGNRVWHANGKLNVQRGDAATAPVDAILSTNANLVDDIQVLHGGKRIFFFNGSTYDDMQYMWNNGSWTSQPPSSATLDSVWNGWAPSVRSRWGVSHDDDAYAQANVRSQGVELTLYKQGSPSQLLATLPEAYARSGNTACTRLDSIFNTVTKEKEEVCKAQGFQGTEHLVTASDRPGYSPRGDRLLLGVATQTNTHSVDLAWYRCLDRHTTKPDSSTYSPTELCRSTSATYGAPSSKLYSVSIPTTSTQAAAVSVVATQGGVRWEQVAFADGRDEFTLQSRTGPSACTTEFRRASAPTQVVYSVPVCGLGEATFSPARIAGGTTLAPPARRPTPPVVTGWRSIFGLRRLLPR